MSMRTLVLGLTVLCLCACGGGDSPSPLTQEVAVPPVVDTGTETSNPSPSVCPLAEEQSWLRQHVRNTYLWNDLTPDRSPDGFTSLRTYWDSLLFQGNTVIPKDRFSSYSTTETFSRYYGEGITLGYGVSVAGLEVAGQRDAPLFVRYVEPKSPAANAGIRRGDEVLAMNNQLASEAVANDDFSALNAMTEGEQLSLVLKRGNDVWSVTVTSALFYLTPVQHPQVFQTSRGAVGYVYVQSMTSQTESRLQEAFARFRQEAVSDVILDLRYNGGGLVSVGGRLASYVAGSYGQGQVYAELKYNAQQSNRNQRYTFSNPGGWSGLTRVMVLAGRRTCSASEQLINGLRGIGVQVTVFGETTCGKPVGSSPTANCGNTFSLVNFTSVNRLGFGGYFDGFSPTCSVPDDVRMPLGHPQEGLLAAALSFAETRICPSRPPSAQARAAAPRARIQTKPEPGSIQDMIPDRP